MLRLLVALLLLAPTFARPTLGVTFTDPVYHGVLDIQPVDGRIDPATGIAKLAVRGWLFLPTPDSNGIFPEREDIAVMIGENTFTIPAGALHESASGKRFSYRAKLSSNTGGVRSLQFVRRPDTWYKVRFQVQGLDLPALLTRDPVCTPAAVRVGDDHFAGGNGYTGVDLTRRTFNARHLRVKGACPSGDTHHGHPVTVRSE